MFIFSSCTMEKRVYNDGYHISWKNGKNPIAEKNASNVIKEIKTISNNAVEFPETAPVLVENSLATTVSDENLIASIDNTIPVPTRNTVSFITNNNSAKVKSNTASENKSVVNTATDNNKKESKKSKKSKKSGDDIPTGLLYVLCFFIPVLAVGFATDWDVTPVVSNLLWTLLCGVPGIIHAIIVVGRER